MIFFQKENMKRSYKHSCSFFLLPLYSGGEMWEGIWNQTHLEVLHFGLKRLHHVYTRLHPKSWTQVDPDESRSLLSSLLHQPRKEKTPRKM